MVYLKIIDEINKARKEFEQTIADGKVHDYETYKYFVGRIQGLKDAVEICHDTVKRNNND